jgi:hypothetical protein
MNRPRLTLERSYSLPEVRLRFRATEMAVLRNSGTEALLATAAFSNIGYYLVLFDGTGEVLKVVPNANVGWAMQSDGEGGLICGGHDLTHFDPASGEFELLAEKPVAPEELYGACVTDKYVVMGSSTPKGTVAVYDREARRIAKSFTPIHSHAFYTYDIIEAPDGKVLIFSSAPRAAISVLDQETLGLDAVIPEALSENRFATGPKMLDDETLFVRTETDAVLLSYPGFETVARIANPEGVGLGFKTCAHASSVAAWGANRPWLLDRKDNCWQAMTDAPAGDPHPECPETCVAMASLEDGALVGVTDSSSVFWRLEAESREPSRKTIELFGPTDGAPLVIGGGRAWGSSHAVQRFWSVDLESGEGRDLGQCSLGGQANSMLWDDDRERLLMGTYPECRIRAFDPAHPPAFPENPGVFSEIGNGLSRTTHQLLPIDNSLWTCANAAGQRLGGAVVRVDAESGEAEAFYNLVPNESPGEMVLGADGRTLCFGTTVHADCGMNIPVSPAAHIVAFDVKDKRLLAVHRPVEKAQVLSALSLDSNGRLLFLDGPRLTRGRALWAWDLAADRFERIGTAPDGLREILPSPDGAELWATALEGVGPLSLGDKCRIDFSRGHTLPGNDWDQKMCKHLQWDKEDPDVLWCICFTEILRFRAD